MTRTLSFLGTFGLGAGFAYLFDWDAGRRRRTLLRDKSRRGLKVAAKGASTGVRDLGHRTKGLLAEARHRRGEDNVSDIVLRERVRSQIGRLVPRPHAVHVEVQDCVVTLSGEVMPSDVRVLLEKLPSVRGVRQVEDRFAIHCDPAHIPSLQGGRLLGGARHKEWKPGIRLAVLGACVTAKALAWPRGGWVRWGTAAGASLLALRALSDKPLRTFFGFGGRRLVQFHKTLVIDAPTEEVFAYWSNYDHFAEFMSHVREVKQLGNGRSRWTVTGPFGAPVTWVAETSAFRPNELLAWRSANGSLVKHSGIIQFQTWGDGTKIEVEMTYNPPGGFLGHAIAWLFRKDPKHALDEDLIRLKTLLEIGKTSVEHQAVLYAEQQPSMH